MNIVRSMMKTNLKLQTQFTLDYASASVKKWRSSRTGLEVTLISQESPMVKGYFPVTTEIMNDSGCPHTLEHLIFMGSKKYPYKGFLDLLGNQAFSSTNAWTATDQTVYTITTAGWEGFNMILPVYLDHILYPTITDAACYTEVYHIDSEGKDKGVVYSEMQGIENQSYFVEQLESQRTLYKKSGYRSETGGLTKNLRVLENDTIRKYHADNYRPDNLCVIVAGSVDEDELIKTMTKFDDELKPLPSVPNKRPFIDSPHDKPLTKQIIKQVEFPDEDEPSGEIQISWIGPDGRELVIDEAISTLGKYFTSSSISLFSKKFIEIDHPLATLSEFYSDNYLNSGMNILFNNVPTDKIDELPGKVMNLLHDHCDPKKLDLKRLRSIVEENERKYIFSSEKSPDNVINMAVFEAAYGNTDGSDLKKWVKGLHEYEVIKKWDINQWIDVYQKYFLDNKACIIVTKPSKALYLKFKAENKKRIDDRIAHYGPDGLKKLAQKLDEAEKANNRKIPQDIWDSFGHADPAKIHFIHIESAGVGLNKEVKNSTTSKVVKKILDDSPKDLPLYVDVESIKSKFATIHLLFSSLVIDQKYLRYIPIFMTILSLPIKGDDSVMIPFEEVIRQVKRDTVDCSFSISYLGAFAELLDFKITVEAEKYETAIDWFYKIMFRTKFTQKRVLAALQKLVKGLPEIKRNGQLMVMSEMNRVCFTDRSLRRACDAYQNEEFLRDLLSQIQANKGFDALEDIFEHIRKQLFDMSNIRVLLLLDTEHVAHPISSWTKFVAKVEKSKKSLVPVPVTKKVMSSDGLNKNKKCFIITTPGSDSGYMSLQTSIPFDSSNKDTFKIILGAEYLQCVEGPFWKAIRGTGLAYGANMSKSFECGRLCYTIYRGVDIEKCFDAAKQLVVEFANGKRPIEEKMRLGAVSSVVNILTNTQDNYFKAAARKFFDDVLTKRGPDYNEHLMKAISQITAEDLVAIFNKYFMKVFDPQHSICFISCNPAQGKGISSHFQKLGYEVSLKEAHVDTEDKEAEEEEEEEEDE